MWLHKILEINFYKPLYLLQRFLFCACPAEKAGRAFRYNLLFVPHKRISAAIPHAYTTSSFSNCDVFKNQLSVALAMFKNVLQPKGCGGRSGVRKCMRVRQRRHTHILTHDTA